MTRRRTPGPSTALPVVTGDDLRTHLAALHRWPDRVIADATDAQLAVWHTAEHKYWTLPGELSLGHHHDATIAGSSSSSDAADLMSRAMANATRRGAA